MDFDVYNVGLSREQIEKLTAILNEHKKGKPFDEIREINEIIKAIRTIADLVDEQGIEIE